MVTCTQALKLVSGIPLKNQTVQHLGAAVGGDGRRFLVPQYEADVTTGCCAATVHKRMQMKTRTSPKAATKY
jgi:hypothetical protein